MVKDNYDNILETFITNKPTKYKNNFLIQNISGTTFDIDVPFSYELPDSTTIVTARKLEDEHAAILEMVEDLLNK